MKNLLGLKLEDVQITNAGKGLVGNINSSDLTIGTIIGKIFTTYIFYAAGIGLLVYLIIAGFQFMLSRGDPKATQEAQTRITNAVTGFVVVFLASIIVQLIAQLFGLEGTLFGQIFK